MATLMARRFGPSVEAQLQGGTRGRRKERRRSADPQSASRCRSDRACGGRATAAGWAALLHFNRVESFDPDAVATRTELVALAEAMVDAGVPVTVVSMGSPYVLPGFHRAMSACAATVRAMRPCGQRSKCYWAADRPRDGYQ